MSYDIRPPRKRIAVDWRGKRIIHNQRYLMGVGQRREFFYVEHHQRRVRDGLRKHAFGVLLKGFFQFLRRRVGIYHGAFDSHLLHGAGDQIKAAAVDCGTHHHMVARFADVKNGIMVCRLS